MSRDKILQFAKSNGFIDIEYVCVYEKWCIYNPIMPLDSYLFPCFVLSDGNNIRLSKPEETETIMDYLDGVNCD